jgi:molybdenum cofactor biosynthesis enzyme MoaA
MNKFIAPDKLKYHPRNVAQFLDEGFAMPISAQFRITDRCRFRCVYCDKPISNSDSHVDQRFIDRLLSLGIKSIVLTGGEPVLYSAFDKDIPFLASYFPLGIVTTLCDYRPELEEHFEWVKVSMDTIDDEKFRKIKGNGGLSSILANLERLNKKRKTRCKLGTQIVLTDDNKSYNEMRDFVIRVQEHCDYIQIRPIESEEKHIYTPSDFANLRKLQANFSKVIVSSKFHMNEKPTACPARWSQLLISSNHDVLLCCNRQNETICSIYDENLYDKMRDFKFSFEKCQCSCVMSGNNAYLESLLRGEHREFV